LAVLSLEELEPEPLAAGAELELPELGALEVPEPLVAPLPELDLSVLLLSVLLEELLELGALDGGVAAELDELEPAGGVTVAEPDVELEPDGVDGVVVPLPEVDDEEERSAAGRSGPRSQPVRVAPSARETAATRIETFMWPPWLGYSRRYCKIRAAFHRLRGIGLL
jgi:hypothetical protein